MRTSLIAALSLLVATATAQAAPTYTTVAGNNVRGVGLQTARKAVADYARQRLGFKRPVHVEFMTQPNRPTNWDVSYQSASRVNPANLGVSKEGIAWVRVEQGGKRFVTGVNLRRQAPGTKGKITGQNRVLPGSIIFLSTPPKIQSAPRQVFPGAGGLG